MGGVQRPPPPWIIGRENRPWTRGLNNLKFVVELNKNLRHIKLPISLYTLADPDKTKYKVKGKY